ncbi:MAG TPA: hypothetical protein VE093_38045 [Polyangiaceae bacterium]|jgi:hypothetical protein|nr:hypothetical protein [Polyangiaceae bacterium]
MVRVGDVLGDLLWHGGLLSQALLVLAGLGLLLAIASGVTVVAFRRVAFAVGTATLLVGAAVMGLGAAATFSARAKADERAAAADLEPVRERARREGYEAARVAAIGGLLLGMFPLIAGAAAVLAHGARRPPRRRLRAVRGSPAEASSEEAIPPPRRASRSFLGGGLPALVAGALAALAVSAEIPGRDLDKAAWELLEHEAQIKAGRVAEGCAGLERDVRSLGRAEAELVVKDLVPLADACLRGQLEASPDRAAAAAEILRASPLVVDEAQRERLRREAAGAR